MISSDFRSWNSSHLFSASIWTTVLCLIIIFGNKIHWQFNQDEIIFKHARKCISNWCLQEIFRLETRFILFLNFSFFWRISCCQSLEISLSKYVLRSDLTITLTSHEHHGSSNHWQLECLLDSLFNLSSKPCVTCPLWGKSISNMWIFPHKGPVRTSRDIIMDNGKCWCLFCSASADARHHLQQSQWKHTMNDSETCQRGVCSNR